MSATVSPEDRALHGKMLLQGAVDELARWIATTEMPDPGVAALGASLHYLFAIAAERYGVEGVQFLEGLVPTYAHHAIIGELPDGEGG